MPCIYPDRMSIHARVAFDDLRLRGGEHCNMSISGAYVPADGVFTAMGVKIALPSSVNPSCTWLVFVDTSPHAEWAHCCLYIFVDDEGNVSQPHEDEYPPRGGLRGVALITHGDE